MGSERRKTRVAEEVVVCDPPPSGYYSHDFVVSGIRNSSRIVRIWCLRNTRITEPDIRDAFERFIRDRGGRVEILALHCDNHDVILDGVRVLLANPVNDCLEFRDDIEKNCRHVRRLWRDLGNLADRYNYHEYTCLPLIHMCQFDENVYLGLQYLYRRNELGSLDRLCIKVKDTSTLGRQLLAEFDYVRQHLSSDYRRDPRCLSEHPRDDQASVSQPRERQKPSTRLDKEMRAVLKRAAAGERSFATHEYIEAFAASGQRKAEEYIRTTSKLEIEPSRTALLSIGGADGAELFSILEHAGLKYGALLEWNNAAADMARQKAHTFAKKGKIVKVFEGDAIQKIAEVQDWLSDLRKQGIIDTLCCSVNSLLHELPDRGSEFRLRDFIHGIVSDWKRLLITIREPVQPSGWPQQVELKLKGVRQETLEAFAGYVALRRRFRARITRQAQERVLMPSRLAGEVLFKIFYLKEFDYEIQESVTSFSSKTLQEALRIEFGPRNVDVMHLNSDSFNRLYEQFGIDAHHYRTGKELSKPLMFSGLMGFKGIKRR
jgi:hypothetical protein